MSIARNGSLPLFVIFNRLSDTGAPGAPFYTKMTDKNIKKNKMQLVLSTLCLEEDLNLHALQHEIFQISRVYHFTTKAASTGLCSMQRMLHSKNKKEHIANMKYFHLPLRAYNK